MKREQTIIRFRIPIIIGFVTAAVFMGFELRRVAVQSNLIELLPGSMRSRIDTNALEDEFGSSDMLFLILESGDVLEEKTLGRLERMAREMERLEGVDEVLSLFNTKRIRGVEGAMVVEPAIQGIPRSAEEREKLRAELLENELACGITVSKDFQLVSIILILSPGASHGEVYKAASRIVGETHGPEKVYAGGIPASMTILKKGIARDVAMLVPVAILVMLGVLYAFFRQIRGMLLPFGAVLLTTAFGMGLLPVMGWKLSMVSVILPVMIIAIANNYGIHLVAKYQELASSPEKWNRKELAAEVFRRLKNPVLITGLTTIAGILGLLTHIMVPARQMGLAAAAAIGFALLMSLAAIPAVLSMMKVQGGPVRSQKLKKSIVDRGLSCAAGVATQYPVRVIAGAAAMAVLMAVAAFFIRVDANPENLFSRNHPITRSTRLINREFGGAQNISVLFEGDIKDPELLKRIESYQEELEAMPGVGQTRSFADVVRMMSRALFEKGEPGYDSIPSDRNAVAQYIELYSMGGDPEDFERLVDFNYEQTHLMIRINDGSSSVVKAVLRKIGEIGKRDSALKRVGGYAVIMTELADALVRGQIQSLLFAVTAIALLMMLLFRSFTAGLVASVPLAVSIVFNFGVMGLFGIRLDMATAMITSIVIGAGVDYTIHLLWRYREERRNGLACRDAMTKTLVTTGRGIVFNALTVMAGMGTLILSPMPPLKYFTVLFSVSIFTCMAGALIIVPALCLVLKPKFLEPPGNAVDAHPGPQMKEPFHETYTMDA